ncbi:hypothetical protein EYR36_006755 [Pleurotus pulmonarius]|nr:hypothetical protein EYR36_006755 [Pleurotus pulmonarius]
MGRVYEFVPSTGRHSLTSCSFRLNASRVNDDTSRLHRFAFPPFWLREDSGAFEALGPGLGALPVKDLARVGRRLAAQTSTQGPARPCPVRPDDCPTVHVPPSPHPSFEVSLPMARTDSAALSRVEPSYGNAGLVRRELHRLHIKTKPQRSWMSPTAVATIPDEAPDRRRACDVSASPQPCFVQSLCDADADGSTISKWSFRAKQKRRIDSTRQVSFGVHGLHSARIHHLNPDSPSSPEDATAGLRLWIRPATAACVERVATNMDECRVYIDAETSRSEFVQLGS